ncbi:hypothetical protein Pyn_04739 [Prunus yedoensis var. nudiflora]|uniref:DNA-directed RNA polymerases II IV and V subunit 12 n=1 Tax=Prunus yedoensis var. nudiflora TaxID=2094558 RepID=A0A314ZHK2_PRUYE|nr:hypothetical protein Pyn_04739 [Prunus yedoensis var. nudiflora]
MDPQPEPVYYICGDCGMEIPLKPNDVIQCRECGYRILYKKRTRRTCIFNSSLAVEKYVNLVIGMIVISLHHDAQCCY